MKPIKSFLAAILVIVVSLTSPLNAQPLVPSIIAASYAPDGSRLAVVGTVQDVEGVFIFDMAGQEQARISMRAANSVAWGPDGRLAVRWYPEQGFHYVISIIDPQTWEETVRVDAPTIVNAPELLWSPDGQMLLDYGDSKYRVWSTADGKLVSEKHRITKVAVQDAFWHPMTQEIYILDTANLIRVFDPHDGNQTREPIILEVPPREGRDDFYVYASQMEICSDGSQIAIAFNEPRQRMQIIDTVTGETIHLFYAPEPDIDIRELRWTTDGKSIATLSDTRKIDFWSIESGELQGTLPGVDLGIPSIRTFVFHPDGAQLAIVGTDTSVPMSENPPKATAPVVALLPATAVLLNLDQIPMFMRAPN